MRSVILFLLGLLTLLPAEARSPRHRNGITSDTAAFYEDTGARDLAGVNKILRFVTRQDVLQYFVLYPMKSAQNAGTGPTVYGTGRLTGNNMTLVNGPTWGASGLAFASASSQYGSIADFLGSGNLTVFARLSFTSTDLGSSEVVASQYDPLTNERSWFLSYRSDEAGDPFRLNISDNGTDFARYDSAGGLNTTNDQCLVAHFDGDGSISFYQNKTNRSLSLVYGTQRSGRLNSSQNILYAAADFASSPGSFADQTAHALAFLTGSVTTTQRETITDLINAL